MSNLCLRTFKCWFRQRTMPTVNLKGLKNSVFTVCFNLRSLSLIQWKSEKPSSFKGPSSRSKCHYCKLITVASCNAPLHHPLCLFCSPKRFFARQSPKTFFSPLYDKRPLEIAKLSFSSWFVSLKLTKLDNVSTLKGFISFMTSFPKDLTHVPPVRRHEWIPQSNDCKCACVQKFCMKVDSNLLRLL